MRARGRAPATGGTGAGVVGDVGLFCGELDCVDWSSGRPVPAPELGLELDARVGEGGVSVEVKTLKLSVDTELESVKLVLDMLPAPVEGAFPSEEAAEWGGTRREAWV